MEVSVDKLLKGLGLAGNDRTANKELSFLLSNDELENFRLDNTISSVRSSTRDVAVSGQYFS